ncbi:hydantoinase B/oxoprolinase family protein, partial [Chloroflexota bacterium]
AGAVHLPDWVFIRPIFYKNELVFFTCMGTHVPDNGGAQAGAYYLAADSIAEGLNIPPIKIVEKGKMREDVLELILSNNRLPDMMRREIHSLIGSTSVAESRIIELLNKYSKETVFSTLHEMIDRTEKAVRAEIAKWPDGVYYAEVQTDDDGKTIGVPITIRCKLTIKGNEAAFDFSETDDQQEGYINLPYPVTLSMALASSFQFLDPELKSYHNEGSIKPFHVITREATVVHAKPGALTAAAPSLTGARVVECVMSALSQVLPHKAITPYGRPQSIMMIGIDPRSSQLYAYISFCPSGGAGAVYGYDGYQCCNTTGTLGVVSKTDAEEEMVRFPWRVTRYEYIPDYQGAGKWRGAPGIWWEAINEGNDCNCIGGPNDGFHTQGQGQHGGDPTPLNKAYILRGSNRIDIVHPHLNHKLVANDIYVGKGGGGAGVGRPEDRDPEAVRMDVKNELVSVAAARDTYKVVVDPVTLAIDKEATNKLRGK